MKSKVLLTSILFSLLLFSSCQDCGECWIVVDGVEEEGTRTGEVCDANYEAKKQEREDVLNYMQTIYPGAEVEYICEDK